jgi:hypothetical protein
LPLFTEKSQRRSETEFLHRSDPTAIDNIFRGLIVRFSP